MENNGIIVNIWSISWAVPTPFISTYSASKSALEKIMLGIYLEKLNPKVRVLHLNLWPLDQGMCWNSIKEESERYTEKIRKHMMKIQRIHWYNVDNVARFILRFVHSKDVYKIQTLWMGLSLSLYLVILSDNLVIKNLSEKSIKVFNLYFLCLESL
jgi:short-subunit dehydrogenase